MKKGDAHWTSICACALTKMTITHIFLRNKKCISPKTNEKSKM